MSKNNEWWGVWTRTNNRPLTKKYCTPKPNHTRPLGHRSHSTDLQHPRLHYSSASKWSPVHATNTEDARQGCSEGHQTSEPLTEERTKCSSPWLVHKEGMWVLTLKIPEGMVGGSSDVSVRDGRRVVRGIVTGSEFRGQTWMRGTWLLSNWKYVNPQIGLARITVYATCNSCATCGEVARYN